MKDAVLILLNLPRLWPHVLLWWLKGSDPALKADVNRFAYQLRAAKSATLRDFLLMMIHAPEFRSVFYYRTKRWGKLIKFLAPPEATLFLATPNIGPGLFMQHGFATIVVADRIGANCWINQQVTVGADREMNLPIIGNNVFIHCGAKVLGGITVGDNVIVGANAVVAKNVPANCTVAGIPARIIRRDGLRVDEAL
jgi:serine O-acetyltransferase